MIPDGICYRDDKYGLWTGTYIDAMDERAKHACLRMTLALTPDGKLPKNGRIVKVRLVEVEEET